MLTRTHGDTEQDELNAAEILMALVEKLDVRVNDLLQITRRRIDQTDARNAEHLAEFLRNRAASKDAQLAKAAGEAFTAEAVSRIRRQGKGAIHKAKDEGRMLAYKEPGRREFMFPVFQFEGPEVSPWVVDLIEMVGNGFSALHFLTVERKSLRGDSFLKQIQNALNDVDRTRVIEAILDTARKLKP